MTEINETTNNNPETQSALKAIWNDSAEHQAEESGDKPETPIKEQQMPACSEGCQSRFDVYQTLLEQQRSMIRALQREMKIMKESQLAQRERQRRMNMNINELFTRVDHQTELQHSNQEDIAYLSGYPA